MAWPESASRPVGTPIQPSVVYASRDPDMLDAQYERWVAGYTYAREGHPNATGLARKIDQMEGATGGVVLGSGMAAVLMGVCRAVDHVLGAISYMGGHITGQSDPCGGVCGRDPALARAVYGFATMTGMTPGPFDCWLAERGLCSFDLRYDRACASARALSDAPGSPRP